MASLTVRNIDDSVKSRLRIRAAENGRSMEDEARQILRDAILRVPPRSLTDLAIRIFGPEHGVELEPHPPVTPPGTPSFD